MNIALPDEDWRQLDIAPCKPAHSWTSGQRFRAINSVVKNWTSDAKRVNCIRRHKQAFGQVHRSACPRGDSNISPHQPESCCNFFQLSRIELPPARTGAGHGDSRINGCVVAPPIGRAAIP
jgi:hypothetical protein